jgi:hypothetical protein
MALPNFVIVGAAKCGTTSLYQYLKPHPEVFMSKRKEPNFFVGDPGHRNKVTEEEYKALFAAVTIEKAVGEASVAYLYDRSAPQGIYDYLGAKTKIIVLLRNPVDMAYALWGHMVRAGGEKLPFADALQAESQRIQDETFRRDAIGWVYSYAYSDRARYAQQVERYVWRFGVSQVRVYVFEEFFHDALLYYRDVCRLLGVREDFTPEVKIYNPTGPVISTFLQDVVNVRKPWKEPIKLVVPKAARKWLKTRIYWLNRWNHIPLPKLSPRERETAWQLFGEDIGRLEQLLGRNLLSVWRKEGGPSLRPQWTGGDLEAKRA